MSRRIQRNRSPEETLRLETVQQVAGFIAERGSVVIELPDYAKSAYQAIWGRDYSALQPEDARIFHWLDAEVDKGEYNRGPSGAAVVYYSKKGTAAFPKTE